MPEESSSRRRLIEILRAAYSGELAAGLAYRGHWRSLSDLEERRRIQQIEEEEAHHRRELGAMLAGLGARPSAGRELRAALVGRTLGALCHLGGWFAPMYGAGKLERGNIREYELAARFARESGSGELVECLLAMAEVEWEHERYFRSKAAGHWGSRWLRLWPAPPPKESIRATFPNLDAPGGARGREDATELAATAE